MKTLVSSVLTALVLLGACTDEGGLTTDERDTAAERVTSLARVALIDLSVRDAGCTADALDVDVAVALEADPIDGETGLAVSEALLGCLDRSLVARSALRTQTEGISPESLACAADELSDEFLAELMAAAMVGERLTGARPELAAATALGVCLSVEELAERAGQ